VSLWLIDTHILLWAVSRPERLDQTTRALAFDPGEDVMFSAVNIWEIAIKAALGKVDFAFDASEIALEARRVGFEELPVLSSAAARVRHLMPLYRDPFDRLLVAQAIDCGARLLTGDRQLPAYSALVTLVRPSPPPSA